ncbi:putative estrogen receptor binding protein strongylocentrotus purpuratus [Balamuthia mandrillaris]
MQSTSADKTSKETSSSHPKRRRKKDKKKASREGEKAWSSSGAIKSVKKTSTTSTDVAIGGKRVRSNSGSSQAEVSKNNNNKTTTKSKHKNNNSSNKTSTSSVPIPRVATSKSPASSSTATSPSSSTTLEVAPSSSAPASFSRSFASKATKQKKTTRATPKNESTPSEQKEVVGATLHFEQQQQKSSPASSAASSQQRKGSLPFRKKGKKGKKGQQPQTEEQQQLSPKKQKKKQKKEQQQQRKRKDRRHSINAATSKVEAGATASSNSNVPPKTHQSDAEASLKMRRRRIKEGAEDKDEECALYSSEEEDEAVEGEEEAVEDTLLSWHLLKAMHRHHNNSPIVSEWDQESDFFDDEHKYRIMASMKENGEEEEERREEEWKYPAETVERFLEEIELTEHIPELVGKHQITSYEQLLGLTKAKLWDMDIPTSDLKKILKRITKLKEQREEAKEAKQDAGDKKEEGEKKEGGEGGEEDEKKRKSRAQSPPSLRRGFTSLTLRGRTKPNILTKAEKEGEDGEDEAGRELDIEALRRELKAGQAGSKSGTFGGGRPPRTRSRLIERMQAKAERAKLRETQEKLEKALAELEMEKQRAMRAEQKLQQAKLRADTLVRRLNEMLSLQECGKEVIIREIKIKEVNSSEDERQEDTDGKEEGAGGEHILLRREEEGAEGNGAMELKAGEVELKYPTEFEKEIGEMVDQLIEEEEKQYNRETEQRRKRGEEGSDASTTTQRPRKVAIEIIGRIASSPELQTKQVDGKSSSEKHENNLNSSASSSSSSSSKERAWIIRRRSVGTPRRSDEENGGSGSGPRAPSMTTIVLRRMASEDQLTKRGSVSDTDLYTRAKKDDSNEKTNNSKTKSKNRVSWLRRGPKEGAGTSPRTRRNTTSNSGSYRSREELHTGEDEQAKELGGEGEEEGAEVPPLNLSSSFESLKKKSSFLNFLRSPRTPKREKAVVKIDVRENKAEEPLVDETTKTQGKEKREEKSSSSSSSDGRNNNSNASGNEEDGKKKRQSIYKKLPGKWINKLRGGESQSEIKLREAMKENLKEKQDDSRKWIEHVTGERFASEDWVNSLKSGVLLCKLINEIKPGSIKHINEPAEDSPLRPFYHMENIIQFSHHCLALGVSPQDLFDPVDLYEGKNVMRVLSCIDALGRQARRVDTFQGPHLEISASTPLRRRMSEKNLKAAMVTKKQVEEAEEGTKEDKGKEKEKEAEKEEEKRRKKREESGGPAQATRSTSGLARVSAKGSGSKKGSNKKRERRQRTDSFTTTTEGGGETTVESSSHVDDTSDVSQEETLGEEEEREEEAGTATNASDTAEQEHDKTENAQTEETRLSLTEMGAHRTRAGLAAKEDERQQAEVEQTKE